MLYRYVLRPILYSFPPELAHRIAFGALRLLLALPPLRALVRALVHRADPALAIDALGLRFPTPVGLAAGFDKDARGYEALGAAGFGYV
jgi:dihydroorotate dehydrogenase